MATRIACAQSKRTFLALVTVDNRTGEAEAIVSDEVYDWSVTVMQPYKNDPFEQRYQRKIADGPQEAEMTVRMTNPQFVWRGETFEASNEHHGLYLPNTKPVRLLESQPADQQKLLIGG